MGLVSKEGGNLGEMETKMDGWTDGEGGNRPAAHHGSRGKGDRVGGSFVGRRAEAGGKAGDGAFARCVGVQSLATRVRCA